MKEKKMKILIVDDRQENLLALEAVLNSQDYHLISARSGKEALKCLLKDDFAVILLDVQMPGMDGFETAGLIRARKRNKDTPIVFITATYQTTENMTQGYSLGAIDYLFKPFDPQTLKLKIEAFVKMERTTSDLRKAEALARVIGETSTDTVITLDGTGLILNVNPAVTKMFGYEPEELQGKQVSRLFSSESPFIEKALVMSESNRVLDVAAIGKDGAVFIVEIQIGVASIEDQQIFVWSVRDITERKQLEKERKDRYKTLEKLVQDRTNELFLANEKLKKEILVRENISQQLRKTSLKLSNILESITDVFFTLNHQWEFVFVNEEAEKYWRKGKEELIGGRMWDLFPQLLPESRPQFIKAMNSKDASHFEIMGIHSDVPYEVHVYPSDEGLSVYYHDISQRRLFEKEMARLDRLNLVGQMAAGIGHEIRNPLTTVRGFLQLLGDKEEFQKFNSYFELMIEELDRANSIITEFLSLAKNKIVNLKPLSLNLVIKKLFPLIQADAMVRDKDVVMDLQETEILLLDEEEIRQLILNLARNGLEAMSGGGKLTIRTFMDCDEAVLVVEDEGSGINAENLEKMGTPFFTTKESGTGLGLATCFSISARHKAAINIETSPSGTSFFVRFELH
jgi:two-component system, sporulation sensor kinase E